jgi:hypothetical protein
MGPLNPGVNTRRLLRSAKFHCREIGTNRNPCRDGARSLWANIHPLLLNNIQGTFDSRNLSAMGTQEGVFVGELACMEGEETVRAVVEL